MLSIYKKSCWLCEMLKCLIKKHITQQLLYADPASIQMLFHGIVTTLSTEKLNLRKQIEFLFFLSLFLNSKFTRMQHKLFFIVPLITGKYLKNIKQNIFFVFETQFLSRKIKIQFKIVGFPMSCVMPMLIILYILFR